jgi:hypothetical protein
MTNADVRMNNLRELLHYAKLPAMTVATETNKTVVAKPRLTRRHCKLAGKTSAFDVLLHHDQLPSSLHHDVATTLMAKIQEADNLTWEAPLRQADQIKTTILNRLVESTHYRRLVAVTLRVTDMFMGKPRRSDVKIALNGPDGRPHIYFGRCISQTLTM